MLHWIVTFLQLSASPSFSQLRSCLYLFSFQPEQLLMTPLWLMPVSDASSWPSTLRQSSKMWISGLVRTLILQEFAVRYYSISAMWALGAMVSRNFSCSRCTCRRNLWDLCPTASHEPMDSFISKQYHKESDRQKKNGCKQ